MGWPPDGTSWRLRWCGGGVVTAAVTLSGAGERGASVRRPTGGRGNGSLGQGTGLRFPSARAEACPQRGPPLRPSGKGGAATVRMPRQPHARWVSDLRHVLSPPHPLEQGLCAASVVCAIRKTPTGFSRPTMPPAPDPPFVQTTPPRLLERSALCWPAGSRIVEPASVLISPISVRRPLALGHCPPSNTAQSKPH